jgi:hypothetical protein
MKSRSLYASLLLLPLACLVGAAPSPQDATPQLKLLKTFLTCQSLSADTPPP